MRVLLTIIGAFFLAAVSATGEAIWTPVANYVLDGIQIQWLGQRWMGIDKEPSVPPGAIAVSANSCAKRPDDTNLANLPDTELSDEWRIFVSNKGIISARIGERGHSFDVVGIRHDNWIVAGYIGPTGGHGTFYLEQTPRGYYSGYVVADDCHSNTKNAMTKCPYVLFTSEQAVYARQDPILSQKCEFTNALAPNIARS